MGKSMQRGRQFWSVMPCATTFHRLPSNDDLAMRAGPTSIFPRDGWTRAEDGHGIRNSGLAFPMFKSFRLDNIVRSWDWASSLSGIDPVCLG
jgi:hypothetical protein